MRFCYSRLTLISLVMLSTVQAFAQQEDSASSLSEAQITRLDSLFEDFEKQQSETLEIESRLGGAEGIARDILQRRLEAERIDAMDAAIEFARAVASQAEAGNAVGEFREMAVAGVSAEIGAAGATLESLAARTDFPDTGLNAADQAARNWSFINAQRSINRVTQLLGDSFELLEEFGAPRLEEQAVFAENLRQRGMNGSIYLQMAQDAVLSARASASALPDDNELSARVTVATELVERTADILGGVVAELDRLGDDTAVFRRQIITTTGEITPEAFDLSIIRGLFSEWGMSAFEGVRMHGPTFALRLLIFLLIVFAFLKLSRVTELIIGRALNRSDSSLSELLKRMTVSVASNLVLALGVLVALSQFGISLGPLLAGLGIAGFIVGFALQDSLANFASGIMILFYRPYDVGDIIEAGGVLGKVNQMSLVNTTINTFDNQRIVVPNSMIWGNTIKNVTAERVRRVDMMFGISYADDIAATEEILRDIVQSHKLVLPEPEPIIKVHELGDSSVNFVVRPWTNTRDYWEVYWDIMRAVKLRFDEAGISIPFPQRDVHLYSDAAV